MGLLPLKRVPTRPNTTHDVLLVVMRLDQAQQGFPGNNLAHLFGELLLAGPFGLLQEAAVVETELFHAMLVCVVAFGEYHRGRSFFSVSLETFKYEQNENEG